LPDALFITGCDFQSYPAGGQLSFARQMIRVFGPRLALIGVSIDDTPVGRWVSKKFYGIEYKFLAVGHRRLSNKKPFIPARITDYLEIKKHKKQILSLGIKSAFIEAPQILLAVHKWGWDSLCYRFAGVENPLKISRYEWGRLFAEPFEKSFFSALENVDVILACADTKSIDDLIKRSGGLLSHDRIKQFFTRVDTAIFKPVPKNQAKTALGVDCNSPIVVTCGRINKFKGLDLVLEAFRIFLKYYPNARLYFVGDGEDRNRLQCAINNYNIAGSATITGIQTPHRIAAYLNVADLYVVGSLKEGWSLAMLEALACGKPIVSTDISGARDMIVEGENGFVIETRNPFEFANAMVQALTLKQSQQVSLNLAEKYALKNLAKDITAHWKPLANSGEYIRCAHQDSLK
jgi:glycosyltransferase involved in cell wall biosynthesis